MRKTDFIFITKLLEQKAGWNFDESQYFIVDKKISNFIREKGFASVEDLVAELKLGQPALISQVVESLAMSDTSFFRDYDVFARFEKSVLPELRENNRSSKKLRFWSLGCASGQETYSIAMIVRNTILGLGEWDVDIIGTDISSAAIAKAQKGLYSTLEVQMGMNARDILNNFHKEGDQWMVNDDLHNMVEFRRYNMIEKISVLEKFDVIFCRNVLRFFTPEQQRVLVARIYEQHAPGGVLYLGRGEKVEGLEDYYDKISGYQCVYQVKNIAQKPSLRMSPEEIKELGGEIPSFVRPQALLDKRPLASQSLKKN